MTLWSEQLSSLYKIRSVSDLPEQELSRQTVLRGEHFSYQIILRADCNVFCRFSARAFGPRSGSTGCARRQWTTRSIPITTKTS